MRLWNIILPLLFVGLLACVESIKPILGNTEVFLVIEGEITDDESVPYIRVLRSADLSEDERGIPTPIMDAEVTIMDDLGGIFNSTIDDDGQYNFSGLTGEVGRSYQARVEYQGNTYQSSWEELLPVTSIDQVTAFSEPIESLSTSGNIVIRYIYHVLVNTDVPNQPNNAYLKWNISGVYKFTDAAFFPNVCYISVDLNRNNVSIFGDETAAGKKLENHVIYTGNVNFHFFSDYCFLIEQRSLTQNAHRFWDQTKQILDREGGLFENPPGLIQGNFSNVNDQSENVMGYFSASSVHHEIFCIGPNVFEGVQEPDCEPSGFAEPNTDPFCSCFQIQNATLNRPPYWPP